MSNSKKLPLSTGKEFNKKFAKKKFFKLTNFYETHKFFEFKTGMNIDVNPLGIFDNEYSGLYFCDEDNIYRWIHYSSGLMIYIREVVIPDDAVVCVLDDCFRTNKFILGESDEIWNNYEICLKIVKKYSVAIKWVNNKILTTELKEIVIKGDNQAKNYTFNSNLDHR